MVPSAWTVPLQWMQKGLVVFGYVVLKDLAFMLLTTRPYSPALCAGWMAFYTKFSMYKIPLLSSITIQFESNLQRDNISQKYNNDFYLNNYRIHD